jgi:hypothetical protein
MAAGAGGEYRQAAGEGLHHRVGKIVLAGHRHVHVAGVGGCEHTRLVERAEMAAGDAGNRQRAAAIGHDEERLHPAVSSGSARGGGDGLGRLGCGLATLVEGDAPQEDTQSTFGQPEPAAGGGLVAGGVAVEIEAVGNHPHRMGYGIEQARAGQFPGQPPARGDEGQRDSPQPTAGPSQRPRRQRLEGRRELRAGGAVGGESAAATCIVAAAGEGPHVVKRPGHRPARLDDPANPAGSQEAGHPVHADQIRGRHGGMTGHVPRGPVGGEQRVGASRPRLPDAAPDMALNSSGRRWQRVDRLTGQHLDFGAGLADRGHQPLHGNGSTAAAAGLGGQERNPVVAIDGAGHHGLAPSRYRESGLRARPCSSASRQAAGNSGIRELTASVRCRSAKPTSASRSASETRSYIQRCRSPRVA